MKVSHKWENGYTTVKRWSSTVLCPYCKKWCFFCGGTAESHEVNCYHCNAVFVVGDKKGPIPKEILTEFKEYKS